MSGNQSRWGTVVAPAVALCIALPSLLFALVVHGVSADQERDLVTERAGELAAIISVSTSDSRSVLMVAGTSMTSTGGAQTFASVTARTTQTGSTIGVVRKSADGFVVVRSAGGSAPARGSVLGPEIARVVVRAQGSPDMVSDVVEIGGAQHAVLALAVAADPSHVAFLDSSLAPARPAPSNQSSPFRELDVALYASGTADPDHLVLVSGRLPGAHGPVVRKELQVGVDTWSLSVSAREPLIGVAATAFPWLIGGGGLLLAAVMGLLVEALVRRRTYAMGLVEERTHLLQEAQVAAEQANEAREEFFASVSHDIRAPLTAIMGFTELMTIADQDERDEFLQRVRSNVATLGVMVDNMLDHARLQAGALDVDLEPLCLKELVDRCLRDLEPVLTSHAVAVSGSPVMVMADRLAFGRVLANVLVNAVRYSPPGTPIEVELSADECLGRVAVVDRGQGIEEGDLETIFEEFARGSRAKPDGGSGLGLFSVHRLVDAQHGAVGIASTLGEGTTVTIELPLTAGAH